YGRLMLAGLSAVLPLRAMEQQTTTGVRKKADRQASVNFTDLAERPALAPQPRAWHRPLRPDFKVRSPAQTAAPATAESPAVLALEPSPPATTNFLALLDNGTAVPPDTMGAVGTNHVMTT